MVGGAGWEVSKAKRVELEATGCRRHRTDVVVLGLG